MKIFVMTDVHANLPALNAALAVMNKEGYDIIFHTGDAIAIGPYPAECLDLMLNTPQMQFLMGNHDAWYVHGLPKPIPDSIGAGEVQHQHWTHAQIPASLKTTVSRWPYALEQEFEGVRATSLHYSLSADKRDHISAIRDPNIVDLDTIFEPYHTELLFYGHSHSFSDIQGRARYINPGSLGCYNEPIARFTAVELQNGTYSLQHRGVPYDDRELGEAFVERQVPDRAFINQTFLGGRLSF